MGCCSSSSGSCKACPISWLPRIAFGIVFAGFGVAHYRDVTNFTTSAGRIFAEGSVLALAATYLAYVVPALMIVGGVLFAIRQLPCVSKACIVAALSGILGWAGLGLMFMNPASEMSMTLMQQLGAAIQNASVLFILFYMIKGKSCGASKCCTSGGASSCTSSCK